MSSLRVLHVLNELRASGAETGLRDSAARWRVAGIDADILSTGHQEGVFADELRAAGFGVHHLPFRTDPRHLHSLRRLVLDHGYDLVQLHPERANLWYGLALRSARLPVIRTIHNVFDFEGWLRRRRTVQRGLLRRAKVVSVSVGPAVQANERERFANPTLLIPNGIDTERFHPGARPREEVRRTLGVRDEATVVTSVGNCNRAKNHDRLLRALAELPDGLDWHYLHAGTEDPEQSERRLAGRLGIADRCSFLGVWPDVPALQAATDVHAMPSLFEGTGNAAIEALSCGVVSVLGRCAGLLDLDDVVTGGIAWVDPEEVGSIAAGLVDAATGEVTTPGPRRLHEQIAARFGMDAYVDAHVALYREMVGTGRG